MNRRRFLGGTLAAAPAAVLAGQGRTELPSQPQLSAAVAEYAMQEAASVVIDFRRTGRASGESARRMAGVLGLLDRHMQETGMLDELDKRLRRGERPELDVDAIAEIWERYGLQPNMAVLRRNARIPEEDYEIAKSQKFSVHNARLIQAAWKRAGELGGEFPVHDSVRRLFDASSGDCFDCFCRMLRIEATFLLLAGFFGCAPCGVAGSALMAIEGLFEYVLQVCRPSDCSNADMWNCNSFLN